MSPDLQRWRRQVIVINLICTCSKLIFQPKSNKHHTKTGNKNAPHKDEKSKQTESCRDDEISKTNIRKQKICEITYSIRIEGKTNRRGDFWVKLGKKEKQIGGGDFWVKIDPKSPLWQEEEEEGGWRLGFEKERREIFRKL